MNQANQGVVNSAVAVRVVLTHHVANHARTLAELLVGAVAAVEHCVNHAAVNRLHAVSHVWKCTTHDDAHCVVEVGALHFGLKVNLFDVVDKARTVV